MLNLGVWKSSSFGVFDESNIAHSLSTLVWNGFYDSIWHGTQFCGYMRGVSIEYEFVCKYAFMQIYLRSQLLESAIRSVGYTVYFFSCLCDVLRIVIVSVLVHVDVINMYMYDVRNGFLRFLSLVYSHFVAVCRIPPPPLIPSIE